MSARAVGIVVDCADPQRLGAFWRALLGYGERPPPQGYRSWAEHLAAVGPSDYMIVDPGGVGPTILFQPVPEAKVVKNRVHIDVRVSAPAGDPDDVRRARIDAAVEPTVALGATFVRTSGDPDDWFVVMQDPEGNEFCLI
jgi:sarcosine oxidase gamma subunit